MARNVSKLNTRITLVVMALILALFGYEFVLRESVMESGLPELPSAVKMFIIVGMPFALFAFGIQGMILCYQVVGRMRADKQPLSRGKRTLGAWGISILLGAATYLVYQVSTPLELDDNIPGWLGLLIFPLGIATLLVTFRAIALTVGAGGPSRHSSGSVGDGNAARQAQFESPTQPAGK